MQSMMLQIIDAERELNTTEFLLLFIGEGANEIQNRIIADQWLERNPLLPTEP